MSLLGLRLAATAVALWVMAMASMVAVADALPDSTWVALNALPHQGRVAVFALAVDPANNQSLLAGNSDGSLLRSTNGGTTWSTAHTGKAAPTTIAFSPYTSGLVLAGTRGGGAFLSRDGGASWTAAQGLEGRTVRVFAFSLTIVAAGTDRGVYTSTDGASWTQSGLTNRSIDALAVEAIHAPVRMVAGSDAQVSGGSMALYQSVDDGTTWTTFTPPLTGTIPVRFAAGPLPPTGNVRPLLVGTNTGLFLSLDNGATFNPLSGGALLPTTDYTQIAFITDHSDRFYVASDGGGSKSGGLWRSDDGGQSFRSLQPPQASVTALAMSNDEQPTLYVATFLPSNHVASLWTYHDTGGAPQGPASSETPAASGARPSHPGDASIVGQILAAPQLPYVALGLAAVILVLTAVVAHLRGRYR
ncbi:MAG TPA: hypothetical protein VLK30_02305 [Candidatus Limnocylindrales bacterium]|nr:hypothetical protein [Candidatus Limnocylindrales bacterium]